MTSIMGNTPTKESPVCVVPPISNPNTPTKANKVSNAGDGRNTPGHYDGMGACASTTAVFARPRPPCFANRLAPLKVQIDSNNEETGNNDGITNAEPAIVLLPSGISMADLPSAIAPPISPLNRSISVPDLSQVPKSVVLPEHLYNEGDLIQKWLSNMDSKTPTATLPGLSQLPAFSPTPIRHPLSSPPHHPRVSAILHAGSPRGANNSSGNAYMSPRTFSKTRLGRSPAPIFTHVQDLQKMINLMFPENERLSKEVDQLKMVLSDRETALSKLDEQLRKKDRELEEQQLAKERIELEMESATKDRREEAVRNRQLDAEIKSKNRECEQMQIELEKSIQSEKLLQTKFDLLQADLNASKALVNQLTLNHAEQLRQTSQMQERADESHGNVKGLTMRMMEMQDMLTQARGDYEAERHRANLNERDATSAHTQVAELREQVAQLSARLEPLQNERFALEHQVNFLSAEKTRLVDELAVAEQTNDEQQAKLLELIATCGKAQAEAQVTQSQLKSMESLISSQAERIQSLETERARLEAARLFMEHEAKESATKREGEARSSSLQDQFAQVLAAERTRCDILQEKLLDLERERNNLQLEHLSQQADAKAQLEAAMRNVSSLREQLDQQHDVHRNQCADQQRHIDGLTFNNAQLDDHLRLLNGQCDELLNQRDQLLSANTKLEEEKTLTIEEARATNKELLDKVIAFESACHQKDAELERERGLVHELEQHMMEQQATISHLETQLQTSIQEVHAESDLAITERDDQITKLNQSLVAARDQVHELQERLSQTEFNLESVHTSLANSLVDFERKCNELRDQKDMAVRENEMLRHELTFKTHQCDQFKASANAMSEQCRLAVQKLENIAPLVRSLSSTTGQLGNMVSSSSNASSAANNNENEVHNKLSQTLDRLVEILNGFDGRVQLSGRSQQQVPSASMPQLPSPSGIGDRMVNVNNGLSRSQDYPDISRSNTSLASSTGSNAPEGPVAVRSNLDNLVPVSKSYWQSRNQVPPMSTSQIKERFAGPITSTALPKQSVRSKIAPSRPTLATSDMFACEEEPAHEMSELSVTGRLEEMRISELQRRNKAELPHMRSSYAVETMEQPLKTAQRLDPVAPKPNDPNKRLNTALMRGEDDSSYCNYLLSGGGSSTAITEFSNFKPTQNLMANPMGDSDVDQCALNSSAPEDQTLVDHQEQQQSMMQQQFTPMASTQFVVPAAQAIPCVPVGGLAMGGFTSLYTTMPAASFTTRQLHFPASGIPTFSHASFQTPSRKAEAFDIVFEPPKSAQKDSEFKTPQVPARLQARPSVAPSADVSTSSDFASHYKLKKSEFPVMGMLQKSVTPKKTATNEVSTASTANKTSRGGILGRMSFRKTTKTSNQFAPEASLVAGAPPERTTHVSSESRTTLVLEPSKKLTQSVTPGAMASASSFPLQESSKENMPPPQW